MLTVANVTKTYKYNTILEQLDFSVEAGELIHIKGENGSGKSTIFKLIAGIEQPTSGEIFMDEAVYVGALIENPGFMENENIRTNLKFLGKINKKYDEKKTKLLADKLFLDLNNQDSVKKYSLGMRQKAGIIQAIMEEQNLILLDEPTRGLDEKSLYAFNDLVREAVGKGKAVVIASHDIEDKIPYTKKYILKSGRLSLEN